MPNPLFEQVKDITSLSLVEIMKTAEDLDTSWLVHEEDTTTERSEKNIIKIKLKIK